MRALTTLALVAAVTAAPPRSAGGGGSATPAAPRRDAVEGGARGTRGIEWLGPPRGPGAPRRVVSLAPSLTDTVIALGHGATLVGVTRYDDAPEVARLPRVGGFLDPSPEAVVALRPELVLWATDGGAYSLVERIAALGVPVLALPIVSVADVLASARAVGDALGDGDAGERLARSLSGAVEAARRRASAVRPVRALFVVGRDPLVVAGPGSYPDELLRLAGGENVVQGSRPWPVYALERAVVDDPATVIDAAVLEPPEGIHRLDAIPAVRRGDVRRLRDDAVLRPGPKLPQAIEELRRALHPAGARP